MFIVKFLFTIHEIVMINCKEFKMTFAYLTSSCLIQSQIWRMLFQSGSKRSWLVAFSRTRFKYKRTKLWVTELLPKKSAEIQRRSFMFRFQDLAIENTYQVENRTLKNLKISPSLKPMRNRQKPRKIQPKFIPRQQLKTLAKMADFY